MTRIFTYIKEKERKEKKNRKYKKKEKKREKEEKQTSDYPQQVSAPLELV